jgi:hypothetical protein
MALGPMTDCPCCRTPLPKYLLWRFLFAGIQRCPSCDAPLQIRRDAVYVVQLTAAASGFVAASLLQPYGILPSVIGAIAMVVLVLMIGVYGAVALWPLCLSRPVDDAAGNYTFGIILLGILGGVACLLVLVLRSGA